jgi:small-conductance mechanosensitive channel
VLRTAAKVLIYLIGILMVLSTIGVDVTPLLASLGVGSLALGLALQKTLEDFLAGLFLAADQPIRVGDFVELAGGES